MIDYARALKRPFTNLTRLIVGLVLSIIPFVNIISSGYILECGRTASRGRFGLPPWENVGVYFLRGLLSIIITIIYLLPAIIVITGSFGMDVLKQIFMQGTALDLLGLGGPGLATFVLGFFAFYFMPVAILSYSIHNKMNAAFNLRQIWKKCMQGEYFKVWIVLVVYAFILNFFLANLPYIGSGIAMFLVGVTAMTGIGEIYSKL